MERNISERRRKKVQVTNLFNQYNAVRIIVSLSIESVFVISNLLDKTLIKVDYYLYKISD